MLLRISLLALVLMSLLSFTEACGLLGKINIKGDGNIKDDDDNSNDCKRRKFNGR